MAGDWIKIRNSLRSSPQVVRIACTLKIKKNEVIGALTQLWILADEASMDGTIKFGASHLDSELDLKGFSKSLQEVGWLMIVDENTIQCPEYSDHNGPTGKKRAADFRNAKQKRREAKANEPPVPKAETPSKQGGGVITPLPVDTGTSIEAQADKLAGEWFIRKRGPVGSETQIKVYEWFLEKLNSGRCDFESYLTEVQSKGRDVTEYLWKFAARMDKPTERKSIEKIIEDMAKDKTKAQTLGVAFNG